jgi:hypothetical protein
LRELIAEASFKDITIYSTAKTLWFPSSHEFVLRYAAGSALASLVAHSDDKARAGLLAEVAAKLRSAIDSRGLRFPMESNLVVARR